MLPERLGMNAEMVDRLASLEVEVMGMLVAVRAGRSE